MLLPGGLIRKTYDEFDIIADHWKIRPEVRIKFFGIEILSTESRENALEEYAPDLVIIDEADRLQEGGTAATKRLMRYIAKAPETRCCLLSASMFGGKWENIGRLLWLAFRDKSPLPPSESCLRGWDRMIEQGTPWLLPPELKKYGRTTEAIKVGLTKHIQAHPGVVSVNSDRGDAVLRLRKRDLPRPPAVVLDALEQLEETELAPGSKEIECLPSDMAQHRNTLSYGFYLKWRPEPPAEWLEARRMWARFVRLACASRRDMLDTEKQVARSCDDGLMDSDGIREEWLRAEPLYKEGHEAVWLTYDIIDALPKPEPHTLYWVRFKALGEMVSKRLGIPFYNKGAADQLEQRNGPCVLSIGSHGRGRNLQYKWHRNHVLNLPSDVRMWEQFLGRTMRPGQKKPFVDVDVWLNGARGRSKFRDIMEADSLLSRMLGRDNLLTSATVLL